MRFIETGLADAWLIDVETHEDERGLFARTFCADEFEAHGLPPQFVQCSTSYNAREATLRGLHYQAAPHLEGKLVRCTRGAIFDVMVDLRKRSDAFGKFRAFELSADNRRAVYIPPGFAHGFLTLTDEAEVLYQMTCPYAPGFSRGVRWDDATIGIEWPSAPKVLSEADRRLPLLKDAECF